MKNNSKYSKKDSIATDDESGKKEKIKEENHKSTKDKSKTQKDLPKKDPLKKDKSKDQNHPPKKDPSKKDSSKKDKLKNQKDAPKKDNSKNKKDSSKKYAPKKDKSSNTSIINLDILNSIKHDSSGDMMDVEECEKFLFNICNVNNNDYSIVYTNGEFETNIMILYITINAYKKIRKIKPHVIITSIDSYEIIKFSNSLLESAQIELTILKPNIYGCILSESVANAIKPNTCIVSIPFINKDLGSVNNIEKISAILHEKKIPLHSNCSYLLGKHKLDIFKNNIDIVTISLDVLNGHNSFGFIIINNNLMNGYKLHEHSTIFDPNKHKNINNINAAIHSIKSSLENRHDKNVKLLTHRNQIINNISKNFQIVDYVDFLKSDEGKLSDLEPTKSKIVILGPPSINESYYTPSILSLLIVGNKSNDQIKSDLLKKNIGIGTPECKLLEYNNIMKPQIIKSNQLPSETSDQVESIIRLYISDSIISNDIERFLGELSQVI